MTKAKFSITEISSLTGEENLAFECNLCANDEVIARVSNPGTGGDNTYIFKNPVVEQEFGSLVNDELIWELLSEELPALEIPESVFEHRLQVEEELATICNAIASSLLTGWEISPGVGGTTKIANDCESHCYFEAFIESGMNYADHTHRLCVMLRSAVNAELTADEEQQWKIPEFDLRTDTPENISAVLKAKISWVSSILPQLQEREKQATNQVERIRTKGKELADKLGLPFKNGCYEHSFSIEREERFRGDENFSISVNPHCCGNKSSLFMSANRISDEKLLKLLEFCKSLEIS